MTQEPTQTQAAAAAPTGAEPAARAWLLTQWMAGVFAVLLAAGMALSYADARQNDPLKSPQLAELKQKLLDKPADEQLKQAIRSLDLQVRQHYFVHVWRMRTGVWMLLGAAAVFGIAGAWSGDARKRPPRRRPEAELRLEATLTARRSRWSVAACGAGIGAGLFAAGLAFEPTVPARAPEAGQAPGAVAATAAPANDWATAEEIRQNWPRFRGPDGGAVSPLTNVPTSWDVKTGAGMAWKVPALIGGFNSTITWGDKVFFSGGDAAKREVFCLDAKTGGTLWRQAVANVPGAPAKPAEVPDTTGYAASTMASDGRRVYVFFANGDLAALTFDGKFVWSKCLGPLKNAYGHAASLATWRDRLILQLDQADSEDGKSKLYAFDGRTGQVVWQTPRKVGSSWASPIVIEAAGKPQIITLAVPWVIAYSAVDGAELWRVEGLSGEITPSPVFAGGLVLAVSPSEKLMAIRPDGQGDVTKTHVAWTLEENVPDVTSPVGNGELVFGLTSSGLLTCLDAKDGKKVWEHDFEMDCHTSPTIAGGHVYLFGEKGLAVVVEAARQFKELSRTEMGDSFHASPAFAQDRLFLRGVTNIFCIGTTNR